MTDEDRRQRKARIKAASASIARLGQLIGRAVSDAELLDLIDQARDELTDFKSDLGLKAKAPAKAPKKPAKKAGKKS